MKRLSLPRDALINQYMVIYHQKINDEKMEIFPNLTQTTYPLNTVFLYGKYYLRLIYFGGRNKFQYFKDREQCVLREKKPLLITTVLIKARKGDFNGRTYWTRNDRRETAYPGWK